MGTGGKPSLDPLEEQQVLLNTAPYLQPVHVLSIQRHQGVEGSEKHKTAPTKQKCHVLNMSNMMLQRDPEILQQELLKVAVNTRSPCIAVPGGQEDHRWETASWGNILFYNLIVLMVAQLKIKIHWVVTL